MDASRFLFVVVIPPDFESDVREGRSPEIQVNIDATAVRQAALGAGYIRSILAKEISRFSNRNDTIAVLPIKLVERKAFNPNGTNKWNRAVIAFFALSMIFIVEGAFGVPFAGSRLSLFRRSISATG